MAYIFSMEMIAIILKIILLFMFPVFLVFSLVVYVFGILFGRTAILIAGILVVAAIIYLVFYIPYYCESIGDESGLSFEGCGNIVGFYAALLTGFVLPWLGFGIVLITLIMSWLFSNRR